MGNLPRSECRVTVPQGESLISDLEDEFAFQDVKPLVLMRMDVTARPSLRRKNVFGDKQIATGFASPYFEAHEVVSDLVHFTKAIVPGSDRPHNREIVHRFEVSFLRANCSTRHTPARLQPREALVVAAENGAGGVNPALLRTHELRRKLRWGVVGRADR